ncbi:Catechol 1,2-dioxygenase [Colletotrichum sidae]|uniref:Catechol 1,2-dioxygenase n=1 Tax=Colletotrichum sidae TaxID=1347389 RepID=A0A4R8T6L0_9PEZI|nr:Catechol 1,2-dioxygenase [Colletotrichum sidae]
MGPNMTPRNRQIMSSLIRHLHDFTREVELIIDEWMTAVHFINSVGQISSKTPLSTKSPTKSPPSDPSRQPHFPSSALSGPPTPPFARWATASSRIPPRTAACAKCMAPSPHSPGRPVPDAVFDIWQASSNGRYDFQDPENQTPNNLRSKFRADADGRYWFYCYHPTAYSLPRDGPSFRLLNMMDRHPMRPAHIHIMASLVSSFGLSEAVTHPGFRGCTTQLYPKDDPWLETDTVFAVKDDLRGDFQPLTGDDKADLELEYNVVLVPKTYKA